MQEESDAVAADLDIGLDHRGVAGGGEGGTSIVFSGASPHAPRCPRTRRSPFGEEGHGWGRGTAVHGAHGRGKRQRGGRGGLPWCGVHHERSHRRPRPPSRRKRSIGFTCWLAIGRSFLIWPLLIWCCGYPTAKVRSWPWRTAAPRPEPPFTTTTWWDVPRPRGRWRPLPRHSA